MNEKHDYITPLVRELEVAVERGFAVSPPGIVTLPDSPYDEGF